MDISKRKFLAGSGIVAAALTSGVVPKIAAAQPRLPLTSDIGKLDRVLVHSVKAVDGVVNRIGRSLLPGAGYDPIAAQQQHEAMTALLRGHGTEVVELIDALNAAREATLSNGIWEAWVDATYPRLGADPGAITPNIIFGRDEDWLYRLDRAGNYDHVVDDLGPTVFTRDSAFMTPKGLVICNSNSPARGRENMILRFAYRYSPILADVPVALDAVERGFIIEGGDAMVVDEKTLFLGVGYRTSPEAAPILAEALGMDVYAVQIGPPEFLRERYPGEQRQSSDLTVLLLHLDSSFTLVGPKHALALPYLFESDYAEDNPIARFVRGAVRRSMLPEEDAKEALDLLKGLGTLTRYSAGSGRSEKMEGMKLVDFCRAQGYRITNTGGPIPSGDQDAFEHFMSVTYPEQRRQASNVVQAVPGRVIAYEGNPATAAALQADGIAVDTFPGRELWSWHGGPHCLTQPLMRS